MLPYWCGSAGLNMVADIESGYFDKLLLTPANRLSLLIGAMMADFSASWRRHPSSLWSR